ncbi:MAG: ABC transporter substrate-binding protein [Deltaproteobacteria bacterium]
MRKIGVIFCIILGVLLAAGVPADAALKEVSLIPQWLPQAQFAGYMVALEKGFYRDAGIDLNLLRGGPGKPPFEMLKSGRTTFCTGWLSTAIQKRATGTPLVNIAQIMQRSALILVARKNSGITRPEDLNGKSVGLWAGQFYLPPAVFFRKYNLHVKIIPNYSSMSLFLKGGVKAIAAMWYNEYHTLLNSGLNPDELTLFFFSDYGLNFPEDGLYCMEETFRTNPQVCSDFVKASLKGWLYAFDHKDEAIDIVMKWAKRANTGTNRAHQRWMLARMQDLILPDGDRAGLGKLKPRDYEFVGGVLLGLDLIKELPQFDVFYRGPR